MSLRFQIDKEDLIRVGKGAIIAILGALLTYGTEYFTNTDFGSNTAIITAIWAIVVNLGRVWITKETPKIQQEINGK